MLPFGGATIAGAIGHSASSARLQQQQEGLRLKTGVQGAFAVVRPASLQLMSGSATDLPVEDSRQCLGSVKLSQREQPNSAGSTGAGQLLIDHPAESFAD